MTGGGALTASGVTILFMLACSSKPPQDPVRLLGVFPSGEPGDYEVALSVPVADEERDIHTTVEGPLVRLVDRTKFPTPPGVFPDDAEPGEVWITIHPDPSASSASVHWVEVRVRVRGLAAGSAHPLRMFWSDPRDGGSARQREIRTVLRTP